MSEMTPKTLRRAAKAIDDYEDCARLYDPEADEILDLYQLASAWEADIQKGANIATELARQLRTAEGRIEALEKALAHNIRNRVIRMISQGYRSPDSQQAFFPDVEHHILEAVFAEPFIAALAEEKP